MKKEPPKHIVKLLITNAKGGKGKVEWFFSPQPSDCQKWISSKVKEKEERNNGNQLYYYEFTQYSVGELFQLQMSEFNDMKLQDFFKMIYMLINTVNSKKNAKQGNNKNN